LIIYILSQLIVQAYDNGFPRRYDTETVTVTVNRNTERPTFVRTNYNVTIAETQTLGITIETVSARDPDELFVSNSHFELLVLRMVGTQV